jgi:hypothetical protein
MRQIVEKHDLLKHVKEQNYKNESMIKKLWLVSIAYKDHRWL